MRQLSMGSKVYHVTWQERRTYHATLIADSEAHAHAVMVGDIPGRGYPVKRKGGRWNIEVISVQYIRDNTEEKTYFAEVLE